MESPPSSSTWSETFILSDDSGLLLTSGSISSGSMSGESRSGHRFAVELQDSDCDDKSFSQADSLDGMSDIMCGENFNTLKKGPHWIDLSECKRTVAIPIDPPPEFQDKPNILVDTFADLLTLQILSDGVNRYYKDVVNVCINPQNSGKQVVAKAYWTSDFLPFGSPPSSRRSLVSSRLSSSHNSLSVPSAHKVDDSSFIMQAVSHDTLVTGEISDLYNVPFDSDMYAVPVDMIKPPLPPRRVSQHKKRRRNTSSCCHEIKQARQCNGIKKCYANYLKSDRFTEYSEKKRYSVPSTSAPSEKEPIHMTLQEVRHYLQTLYSSSSDSSVNKDKGATKIKTSLIMANHKYLENNNVIPSANIERCEKQKLKKNTFLINLKNKRIKESCDNEREKLEKAKKTPARVFSLKQTLCNIFRFRRLVSPEHVKNARRKGGDDEAYSENIVMIDREGRRPILNRALPPLPAKNQIVEEEQVLDFATSIQKVKDYGWYWGPVSSEAAEKILSNEPDGSFIVRDSSDDHYIFSLTFKLNNSVRHVRIEHDQGNFSFGSCTKFKSQTIVEFIENAVEHSRSGRYLFFLHRRPVIGPVRVQLLHPVSRFKQVQSLQHMCRFVILKFVRRDLIPDLPLPRRMIDYLSAPHYYSEHLSEVVEEQEDLAPNNTSNNNVVLVNGVDNPRDEGEYPRNNIVPLAGIINHVPVNNVHIPNADHNSSFSNVTRDHRQS